MPHVVPLATRAGARSFTPDRAGSAASKWRRLIAGGSAVTPFTIPSLRQLLTVPLHDQAVTLLAPGNDLSLPVSLVMTE